MNLILTTDCWEYEGTIDKLGYGVYNRRKAHRLAYGACVGPIPSGMKVCHSCDNRRCINPSHLWLGTQADNMRDMKEKGRWQRPPKITPVQWELQDACQSAGFSIRKTAELTGISKSQVQIARSNDQ